jgi:hypothetical protein
MFFGGNSPLSARDDSRITVNELNERVASAKTAKDHAAIASYFNHEAATLEAEAAKHEQLAATYRGAPYAAGAKGPMTGKTAEHCDYFAKAARDAAKADRELAAEHEQMAKAATK